MRQFQSVFSLPEDGIVGKSTWYAIQFIYNAVKKLNELDSEGIALSEVTQQYGGDSGLGDRGNEVRNIQYLLRYVSEFYATVPSVEIDGVFGPATESAVSAFQRQADLPVTGRVDLATWDALYRTYLGLIETIPFQYVEGNVLPYPGVPLRQGSETEAVRILQEYLNFVGQTYTQIPPVNVTGYFGNQTQQAVLTFQRLFGIPTTGTVAAVTWDTLADLYSDLYNGSRLGEGQYPGYEIS